MGPLVRGVERGLVVLAFGRKLPRHWRGACHGRNRTADTLRTCQLQEYFSGDRRDFNLARSSRNRLPEAIAGNVLRIPYGETRSYAEIAAAVGRPKAFRAVGQANHYNPVAIVVPCHRVLAGGYLGGYGGGLPVKAFLLRLEGAAFRDERP